MSYRNVTQYKKLQFKNCLQQYNKYGKYHSINDVKEWNCGGSRKWKGLNYLEVPVLKKHLVTKVLNERKSHFQDELKRHIQWIYLKQNMNDLKRIVSRLFISFYSKNSILAISKQFWQLLCWKIFCVYWQSKLSKKKVSIHKYNYQICCYANILRKLLFS